MFGVQFIDGDMRVPMGLKRAIGIVVVAVSLTVSVTVYAVQFQNKLVEHYQQMDAITRYVKQTRNATWATCKLQYELAKRDFNPCYAVRED